MLTFLTDLLGSSLWQLIFMASFFFGLFYFLLLIFGTLSHHGDNLHHHDHHHAGILDHHESPLHDTPSHHIDFDHGGHLSHSEFEVSHDFEIMTDSQITEFSHSRESERISQNGIQKEIVIHSSFKMGNIASFLFFTGIVGNYYSNQLNDLFIFFAFIAGLIAMKSFEIILSNYGQTVIVPLQLIQRGDIGVVINGVTPTKKGMVQVTRKDGVISTIIAKGAFPHDYFEKSQKGYIWGKINETYLITRGIHGQPDLNNNDQISKKGEIKELFDPLLG